MTALKSVDWWYRNAHCSGLGVEDSDLFKDQTLAF
jgi:hypothetical protein